MVIFFEHKYENMVIFLNTNMKKNMVRKQSCLRQKNMDIVLNINITIRVKIFVM